MYTDRTIFNEEYKKYQYEKHIAEKYKYAEKWKKANKLSTVLTFSECTEISTTVHKFGDICEKGLSFADLVSIQEHFDKQENSVKTTLHCLEDCIPEEFANLRVSQKQDPAGF